MDDTHCAPTFLVSFVFCTNYYPFSWSIEISNWFTLWKGMEHTLDYYAILHKKRKYENNKFISIECKLNGNPRIVGTACDFSVQCINPHTPPSSYILQIIAYQADNHANGYRCWCHNIKASSLSLFHLRLHVSVCKIIFLPSESTNEKYRGKNSTEKEVNFEWGFHMQSNLNMSWSNLKKTDKFS